MAQIQFEHAGSNGWAIYPSKDIDADNAQNIHVAECEIKTVNGERKFTLNKSQETICGEKLISLQKERRNILVSADASEIRSKLANLQNGGNEVCGVCVSHFYADSEQ